MAFVQCTIGPGLRESEVQVTMRDITGRPQRLRCERDFVIEEDGKHYFPVGVVGRHPTEAKILIEFPHEADSGANRMFVSPDQLLEAPVAT